MKKILTFIILAAVVFSFSGCASFVESFTEGFKEGYEAGKDLLKDQIGDTTDTGDGDIDGLTRGSIYGGVYTSKYTGLTFNCPDGWSFSTDSEIAEVMSVPVESISPDNYAESAASRLSVYDMMAIDTASGSNVIIMYENLKMTNSENITEETYMSSLEKQLFSQNEVIYTKISDSTRVSLGDVEYVRAVYSVEGSDMIQAYYVRRVGGYISGVVATLVGDHDLNAAEDMFS